MPGPSSKYSLTGADPTFIHELLQPSKIEAEALGLPSNPQAPPISDPEVPLSKLLGMEAAKYLPKMNEDPTYAWAVRRTPEWQKLIANSPEFNSFDQKIDPKESLSWFMNNGPHSISDAVTNAYEMALTSLPAYDAAALASLATDNPLPQLQIPIPGTNKKHLPFASLMLADAALKSLGSGSGAAGVAKDFGQRLFALDPSASGLGKLRGIPGTAGNLWKGVNYLNLIPAIGDPLMHGKAVADAGGHIGDVVQGVSDRAVELGHNEFAQNPQYEQMLRGESSTSPFWNVPHWLGRAATGKIPQIVYHELPAELAAAAQMHGDIRSNFNQAVSANDRSPEQLGREAYALFNRGEKTPGYLRRYQPLINRMNAAPTPEAVKGLTVEDLQQLARVGGNESLMAAKGTPENRLTKLMMRVYEPPSVDTGSPDFRTKLQGVPGDYRRHLSGLFGLPSNYWDSVDGNEQ